jgi:pimeloyl-ACP methyl ester carboxylesterase
VTDHSMLLRVARRSVIILTALLLVILAAASRHAAAAAVCDPDGVQPGGAIYRLCMPSTVAWNGNLVIWAHGYVDATQPVAIPEDQLCLGGTSFCIPDIATGLGFGFITTSYRMNGLVTTGVEDVTELIDIFAATHGTPGKVFIVGASEGGLVTTLAVEQHPDLFAGGLAACGPIGDFHRQVNYYGDFRVLFDYFFPGLMPGSPLSVPQDLIDNWDTYWTGTIRPVVFDPSNAGLLSQLQKTARAPYDPNDPSTLEKTVQDALWYNVFATNDIIAKLGGQPFDNMTRHYYGSADDTALNATVARYAADPAALTAMDDYLQTSGDLHIPLVTMHTLWDQQVGFVQELLYGAKTRATGTSGERVFIPSLRYGHCNFKPWEALLSFAILLYRSNMAVPASAVDVLQAPADRDAFRAAARQAGIRLITRVDNQP